MRFGWLAQSLSLYPSVSFFPLSPKPSQLFFFSALSSSYSHSSSSKPFFTELLLQLKKFVDLLRSISLTQDLCAVALTPARWLSLKWYLSSLILSVEILLFSHRRFFWFFFFSCNFWIYLDIIVVNLFTIVWMYLLLIYDFWICCEIFFLVDDFFSTLLSRPLKSVVGVPLFC